MGELPPDLDRLRVIRLYLQLQLDAVDARLAEVEGQPAAGAGREPTIGKSTGWRLQHVPDPRGGPGHGVVHRGDCPQVGGGWLSRRELAVALELPEVTACPRCQPQA